MHQYCVSELKRIFLGTIIQSVTVPTANRSFQTHWLRECKPHRILRGFYPVWIETLPWYECASSCGPLNNKAALEHVSLRCKIWSMSSPKGKKMLSCAQAHSSCDDEEMHLIRVLQEVRADWRSPSPPRTSLLCQTDYLIASVWACNWTWSARSWTSPLKV